MPRKKERRRKKVGIERRKRKAEQHLSLSIVRRGFQLGGSPCVYRSAGSCCAGDISALFNAHRCHTWPSASRQSASFLQQSCQERNVGKGAGQENWTIEKIKKQLRRRDHMPWCAAALPLSATSTKAVGANLRSRRGRVVDYLSRT